MRDDLYLFNHGNLERAWRVFGAHPEEDGVRFTVWAPYAKRVAVVGDFNDWDGARHRLAEEGTTGVWTGVVPGAHKGQLYKYELEDATGKWRQKLP